MKPELLALLRCPRCGGHLRAAGNPSPGGDIEEGELACDRQHSFPIVRSIPRFVPSEGETASFGLQWNRFRETQLDSHSGLPISRERFFGYTGWEPASLAGRLVLDAGCGAGRFAEVALAEAAEVVAVDRSLAVDACRSSFGRHPRLHLVQADIRQLPFEPGGFDDAYCLGVLQHTPDPAASFAAVARHVRPGGRVAVDVYPRRPANLVWPKYWLRPLTRRLPPGLLFRVVERATPSLLRLSGAVGRLPRLGPKARRLVPVADYEGRYPLSPEQRREFAVLDTFDMLAPTYDHPQSPATLRQWFAEAGFEVCEVLRPGHLVGRGTKPTSS